MPIVVSYDDPSLVARLGDEASGYQAAVQTQQMANQALAQRQNEQLRQQGLDQQQQQFDANQALAARQQDRADQQQQMQAAAILQKQQQADTAQKASLGYVDSMQQNGTIDQPTADRMRGDLTSGGNPFKELPFNQQMELKTATKTATDQLTPYQQANLAMKQQQYADQKMREEAAPFLARLKTQMTGDETKSVIDQLNDVRHKYGFPPVSGGTAGWKPTTAPISGGGVSGAGPVDPVKQHAATITNTLEQFGVPQKAAAEAATVIAQSKVSGRPLDLKLLAQKAGDKETFIKIMMAMAR